MPPGGVDPGLLGSLFQAQAKRLEAQVLRQLQDKKTIEFLMRQLLATGHLVTSLEQHHVSQVQKIESNLGQALRVYEKARILRQQQNQVPNLVATLSNDLRVLRAAANLESTDDAVLEASAMPPPPRPLNELPSLADLLPQSQQAGGLDAGASSTSRASPPVPSAASSSAKPSGSRAASDGVARRPAKLGAGDGATETALEVSTAAASPSPVCPALHSLHSRALCAGVASRLCRPQRGPLLSPSHMVCSCPSTPNPPPPACAGACIALVRGHGPGGRRTGPVARQRPRRLRRAGGG